MKDKGKGWHTFGINLRHARELAGMSQTQLAKLAGFQPSAISHFETGRREPTLTNAVRLARSLGKELSDLI